MLSGAAIKYNMPAFKPFPGASPICSAVFVQMEHCAVAIFMAVKLSIIMITHFFIISSFALQK